MITSRKQDLKALSKQVSQLENKEYAVEDLNQWIMYGVDYEHRKLDINMDVDEQMSNIIRRAITKFVEMSDKLPITIYLSTNGGDMGEMFSIIDILEACPCPIIIVASGKIMSAGLPIFLTGDVRVAYPHTRFMMHSLSHVTRGKLKDTEIDVKEGKYQNSLMVDLLVKKTKKNKKWWESAITSHDFYFGVKEAKEMGVIQESNPKLKVEKK